MVVSLSERLGITALAKRPVLRPAGTHDYFLRAARRAAQREGDIRHVDMIREAIDVDGRLVLARLTGSIHRTDAMLETCRLEAPPPAGKQQRIGRADKRPRRRLAYAGRRSLREPGQSWPGERSDPTGSLRRGSRFFGRNCRPHQKGGAMSYDSGPPPLDFIAVDVETANADLASVCGT